MKLDLFRIDDFIEANKCPEVTNPIFWNYDGNPTSDGLFSYELFGFSDEDRKNIFGYIDLKNNYIHPLLYTTMTAKMGSIGKIIIGEKYAVVANKKIKIVDEDFEGAETGIDFFYNNFDQINWIDVLEEDEISSIDKKTRLKLFKSLKKEEFFVNKWLVLPPFYRAASATNKSMGDSINNLYKELLSKVRGMDLGFSFEIFGSESRLRVQNILKDLYLSTISPISGKNLIFEKNKTEGTLAGSGKNSMVRKHLLGKTIDWSSSSVITSPHNSNANTPDKKPVPWGYGCFPLASLISMFQPFFVHYCNDFLEQVLSQFAVERMNDIKKIDVGQFNSEKIEKMLKKYIKEPESRFERLVIEYIDKKGEKKEENLAFYEFKTLEDYNEFKNYIMRPTTVTDIFYDAAIHILSDKHVYVTRFPVANFQNIYPSKIKVLTTGKTRKLYYSYGAQREGYYGYSEEYPAIPTAGSFNKNDLTFYDVMLCGNAYLDSLGRGLRWGYAIYESCFFSRSK